MKTSFAFCKESVCLWSKSTDGFHEEEVFQSIRQILAVSSGRSQRKLKERHLIMKRTDHWGIIWRAAVIFHVRGEEGFRSSLEKTSNISQTISSTKYCSPNWQWELDKMTAAVSVDLKHIRTLTTARFCVQKSSGESNLQNWPAGLPLINNFQTPILPFTNCENTFQFHFLPPPQVQII